ncbi:hypothetical protein [Paraburkholderia largidicola]|nr:hypothetical protein [Paraburkholderia sp. PGU16]
MMPTLLEQAQLTRTGLDQVIRTNQLRSHLSAIQNRSAEWSRRKEKRAELHVKSGYLAPPASKLAELASADEATRALCAEARERLSKSDGVDALSRDEFWIRLLAQADKANSLSSDAIRASWRALIRDLGEPEASSALLAREPETPGNKQALARYREVYTLYASLKSAAMPPDTRSADALRQHVEELRKIVSTLTPTPQSVKLFFKAMEADGAALDLLTEEVLIWLRQYDDTSRFVIRTRTVGTWR